MNRNQHKGMSKQAKGAFKEVVGKATGDKLLEGEGKATKGVGKTQRKVGNVLDAAPPGRDRCN